jgi:hypothetical protein
MGELEQSRTPEDGTVEMRVVLEICMFAELDLILEGYVLEGGFALEGHLVEGDGFLKDGAVKEGAAQQWSVFVFFAWSGRQNALELLGVDARFA